MKNLLSNYFKDDIVFTEINGKKNVVTFISKAKTFFMIFALSKSQMTWKLRKKNHKNGS